MSDVTNSNAANQHDPSHQHQLPVVGTNHDVGTLERGADIIDGFGGMVYLPDADIPLIIALLARHLSGENISILDQTLPEQMSDSLQLSEAVQAAEQHMAVVRERLARLVQRTEELEVSSDATAVPHGDVQYVRLEDVLFGDADQDSAESAAQRSKRIQGEC